MLKVLKMFPFSPPHFSLCLGKCFNPLIFGITKVDFDFFFNFAKVLILQKGMGKMTYG
jgi:hypothetical protein